MTGVVWNHASGVNSLSTSHWHLKLGASPNHCPSLSASAATIAFPSRAPQVLSFASFRHHIFLSQVRESPSRWHEKGETSSPGNSILMICY